MTAAAGITTTTATTATSTEPSVATSTPSVTPEQLPTSVRGAPAELRRLIRKRQNSESAKRCRLRRKLEAASEAGAQMTTTQKMAQLEALVAQLAQGLAQTQNALAALLHNTPMSPATVPPPIALPTLPAVPLSTSVPTSPMTPTTEQNNTLQIPPLPATTDCDTMPIAPMPSTTATTTAVSTVMTGQSVRTTGESETGGEFGGDIDIAALTELDLALSH